MKVVIDRETCISCGTCWETCPELFEENTDDSFSQIVEEFQLSGNIGKGTVPERLEHCAQDAADLCPVQIIHVN